MSCRPSSFVLQPSCLQLAVVSTYSTAAASCDSTAEAAVILELPTSDHCLLLCCVQSFCFRLNQLTPPKTTPEIIKFLKQFTNPLMALLLVAGALTFMAYGIQSPRDKNNAILAAALLIVVTLTCLMSYLQERSASSLMGGLLACWAASGTMLCSYQTPARMIHEHLAGNLLCCAIARDCPAPVSQLLIFIHK